MADPQRCEYEPMAGGTFCRHHYGAPSGQCLTAVGKLLVGVQDAEAEIIRLRKGLADRDAQDAKHEEERARLVRALRIAKSTIRAWHAIRLGGQEEPAVWQDYQASPEMQAINDALSENPE